MVFFNTISSVKQFVATEQIFVYKFIVYNFRKKEKNSRKPFTLWKWKHIMKESHILKMKAHSETHFENENIFLEKCKLINPFLPGICKQYLVMLITLLVHLWELQEQSKLKGDPESKSIQPEKQFLHQLEAKLGLNAKQVNIWTASSELACLKN